MKARFSSHRRPPRTIRNLAAFRYNLRKFLRFSEKAARQCGVTPQQHQLMLGVAGYTGRGSATVSELAEFLQARHNAVVELVARAVRRGLVHKERSRSDHRFVNVSLTRRGRTILSELAKLHAQEIERVQRGVWGGSEIQPRLLASKKNSVRS
jgi:DNA-binding MarR family transcriptional regulator